eukprot:3002142-Rhodomonas_salina.1
MGLVLVNSDLAARKSIPHLPQYKSAFRPFSWSLYTHKYPSLCVFTSSLTLFGSLSGAISVQHSPFDARDLHTGCPAQCHKQQTSMEGYSLTIYASKQPKLHPATQAVRPVAVGAADPNFVLLQRESKGNEIWKTSDASRMAPT